MRSGPARENLVSAITEICQAGHEPDALRAAVLPRLRRAVPVDALWWAIVDPSTLLFTQACREELPSDTGPYFVENEFLRDDVNKWTELARDPAGVRTLARATNGELARSDRYRDIFEPLGLADELRAVMRTRGAVWGFMCLHRERGAVFSEDEAALIARVAPQMADGIRIGQLLQRGAAENASGSPGLVLLAPDGSLAGANAAAERWLDELDPGRAGGLPLEVLAVAGRLRQAARGEAAPRLRVRTRAGRWAVLEASRLAGEDAAVAVIVQEATPAEVAPLVMLAYGLTARERVLSGFVFRGLSTRAISAELRISEHTVQDHLKSIFDKTGVRSRRELVATVLRDRYLPRPNGR